MANKYKPSDKCGAAGIDRNNTPVTCARLAGHKFHHESKHGHKWIDDTHEWRRTNPSATPRVFRNR